MKMSSHISLICLQLIRITNSMIPFGKIALEKDKRTGTKARKGKNIIDQHLHLETFPLWPQTRVDRRRHVEDKALRTSSWTPSKASKRKPPVNEPDKEKKSRSPDKQNPHMTRHNGVYNRPSLPPASFPSNNRTRAV